MRFLVLTDDGELYFRPDLDIVTIDQARNGDYILVDCENHMELSMDTGGEWEIIPTYDEVVH